MSRSMESIIEKHLEIYFLLKDKPYTVRELRDETGLADQTIRDALERLENIGEVRKLPDETIQTFAHIDYTPLKGEIKDEMLKDMKIMSKIDSIQRGDKMLISELEATLAVKFGENPNDEHFQKVFYEALSEVGDYINQFFDFKLDDYVED